MMLNQKKKAKKNFSSPKINSILEIQGQGEIIKT